jgi:hypothetical protein
VQGHALGVMITTKVERKQILTLKDEVHAVLGGRHNEII